MWVSHGIALLPYAHHFPVRQSVPREGSVTTSSRPLTFAVLCLVKNCRFSYKVVSQRESDDFSGYPLLAFFQHLATNPHSLFLHVMATKSRGRSGACFISVGLSLAYRASYGNLVLASSRTLHPRTTYVTLWDTTLGSDEYENLLRQSQTSS